MDTYSESVHVYLLWSCDVLCYLILKHVHNDLVRAGKLPGGKNYDDTRHEHTDDCQKLSVFDRLQKGTSRRHVSSATCFMGYWRILARN